MAGQVTVDQRPAMKPGVLVHEDVALSVDPGPAYVSRGGEKLAHALAEFAIDVTGLVAADIGSSTGGFTDCLLQHGAAQGLRRRCRQRTNSTTGCATTRGSS